jgi:hypothetical protein
VIPYQAVAVTLLFAALQVLAGAWLARAVFPAKGSASEETRQAPEGSGVRDLGGPQT